MLASLVTWSLGRLVQSDSIGDTPRAWASKRLQKYPNLHYLFLECLWCLSFWIAIPVTIATGIIYGFAWHLLAWPLAIRVAVGMYELAEENLWASKDALKNIAAHYQPAEPTQTIYVDPDAEGNTIT